MTLNTKFFDNFKSHLGEGGTRAWKHCGMKSGAWCCAEVTTEFYEVMAKKLFYGGNVVVYCPTAIKWCKTHLVRLPLFLAMPADTIFFDWNNNGVPDHIGSVRARRSCSQIDTIEGNTGSPARIRYKTRPSRYVLGIYRPHFTPTGLKKEKLVVDGQFDYQSIYMLQIALGVSADAILGRETLMALQKKAGVAPDADWGAKTSKAVQKMVGVTQDGEFGINSVKALQTWINNNVNLIPSSPSPTPEPPKPIEPLMPTVNGYTGAFPPLNSVQTTINFANSQIGTYAWRGIRHKKFSNKFTKFFAGRYGIDKSGQFPNYKNDIAGDCDLFAFGYCLEKTGVPQKEIMDAMGKVYWWWSANLYRFLKKHGKVSKTPKPGAIGLYGGNNGICTHVCLITGVSGGKIQSIDKIKNKVKACNRSKSAYLGFYMPDYRAYLMKGDTGEAVGLLQDFLNWYGGYNLKPDCDFGELTAEAVIDYQTKEGLTVDGKFGTASLTRAKTIQR